MSTNFYDIRQRPSNISNYQQPAQSYGHYTNSYSQQSNLKVSQQFGQQQYSNNPYSQKENYLAPQQQQQFPAYNFSKRNTASFAVQGGQSGYTSQRASTQLYSSGSTLQFQNNLSGVKQTNYNPISTQKVPPQPQSYLQSRYQQPPQQLPQITEYVNNNPYSQPPQIQQVYEEVEEEFKPAQSMIRDSQIIQPQQLQPIQSIASRLVQQPVQQPQHFKQDTQQIQPQKQEYQHVVAKQNPVSPVQYQKVVEQQSQPKVVIQQEDTQNAHDQTKEEKAKEPQKKVRRKSRLFDTEISLGRSPKKMMYNEQFCEDVLGANLEEDISKGQINETNAKPFTFDPKPYVADAENDVTILDNTSINDTTILNSTYKRKGIFGNMDSTLNTTIRTRRQKAETHFEEWRRKMELRMSIKNKLFQRLENRLFKRMTYSCKGYYGVIQYFNTVYEAEKESLGYMKKMKEIHPKYTENQSKKSADTNLNTGDFPEKLPLFFKAIYEFDAMQTNDVENRKSFLHFIHDTLVKKLKSHEKDYHHFQQKWKLKFEKVRLKIGKCQKLIRKLISGMEEINENGIKEEGDDCFKNFVKIFNEACCLDESFCKLGCYVQDFWKELCENEAHRKSVLKLVITDYLTKKREIFGKSSKIDKTITLVQEYLRNEDIQEYFSYENVLTPEDVQDIKTLLSSSAGKVTEKTLTQFVEKRLISTIDKSPYLAFKMEVQVKAGKILKSTKECYLGKTLDENLIIFDRTLKDAETKKYDCKNKTIHKFGKLNNFSIEKRSDSSVQLIERSSVFFGLFDTTVKMGVVVKDKKDIDILNTIIW